MKKVVLVVLGAFVIALSTFSYRSVSKNNKIPHSFETIAVKVQNLYNSVVVPGIVIGNNRQSIIFSESSNILDVYVKVGQTVKKGDKILLRKRTQTTDPSLQVFTKKVGNVLSEYGIDFELTPTISENTALVTSSFDGVITKLHVESGESFPGYTVAAEICDQSVCTVTAEIPELYVSSIRIGQEATVSGAAFAQKEYSGVVTAISRNVRKKVNLTGEGSAYLPVEIRVKDADSSLKAGCTATVKILTEKKEQALVLPYDCITQDDNGKELVFIAKADGTLEKRRIITGLELEHETEIVYGLKEGEKAVRDPNKIVEIKGEDQ